MSKRLANYTKVASLLTIVVHGLENATMKSFAGV